MGNVEKNRIKYKLLRLMNEKQKLEYQIGSFGEILKNNADVGMSGPLVDSEGYPRNDIDVYEVRRARQNIICLQNDYKVVMEEIETLLHELHSKYKDEGLVSNVNTSDATSSSNNEICGQSTTPSKPILKVNQVGADSPAEQAGLRNDDAIVEFGTINYNNFNKSLDTIKVTIQRMRNQKIPLVVLRENEMLNLILIPKNWLGGGLLGCNITLYD